MDFCAEDYKYQANGGLWIEENAFSLAQSPPNKDKIPAGFTREYRVLTEVCASMSSGFLLLNQHERVTYSNPSALRLLRVNKCDPVILQHFDVRKHLLSMATDPQKVRVELDQLWQHPDQEYTADLALADALHIGCACEVSRCVITVAICLVVVCCSMILLWSGQWRSRVPRR